MGARAHWFEDEDAAKATDSGQEDAVADEAQ